MRWRRARLILVACLVTASWSAAVTRAGAADAQEGPPFLGASVVDELAGTVELRVTGSAVERVRFSVGGEVVATVPYRPELTTSAPVPLTGRVSARADGLGASDAVVWTVERVLDPEDFAPHAPHVSLVSGRAVARSISFEVSSSARADSVHISIGEDDSRRTIELPPGATWPVSVDSLDLPYGPLWLAVTTRNAFGASAPRRVRLYNVGRLTDVPATGRRVLVDKRAMRTYHVLNRRVLRSWPIATGMPSAPTPSGLFRLGAPQRAGGPWGVLRRPLQRHSGGRWVGTSYYIHGTNEPWSIGMMASHGCVRMFNSHIRAFSRSVPTGTLVRIR